jgi:DNA helicase-2/ATP-dependent DNA helicase PcrA
MNMASYYDGIAFPDNVASFLEDIALITDQDRDAGEQDAVSLMTIHLAKGLEFRHVIIAGAEE